MNFIISLVFKYHIVIRLSVYHTAMLFE